MNEANPNVIPESFNCPERAPEFLRNTSKESTSLGVDETPIFKPYYIEVCEEPEGSIDEEEDHAKELLSEYERTNGNPFKELGKRLITPYKIKIFQELNLYNSTIYFLPILKWCGQNGARILRKRQSSAWRYVIF